MTKITPSKTTKKKPVVRRSAPNPLAALKRTVARTSRLAETMLEMMEKEMTGLSKKDGQWKQMFGPSGAISSLHKLMQVLDKLGDQVEQMQKLAASGKTAASEPISKEDIRLLEDWLKQK